jgi:hypothetical protein
VAVGAVVYMVGTSAEHVPGSCVVGFQLQVGSGLRTTMVANGVGASTPPRVPVTKEASIAEEVFIVMIWSGLK